MVKYGLQNLGFSSESVDWMLQAKLQNTDTTRTLAQGRSVLDVNGSTVVGYNGTVPTCDDGIWDLELVATDRHGDQHRQPFSGRSTPQGSRFGPRWKPTWSVQKPITRSGNTSLCP